jgi:hypothetical protein
MVDNVGVANAHGGVLRLKFKQGLTLR